MRHLLVSCGLGAALCAANVSALHAQSTQPARPAVPVQSAPDPDRTDRDGLERELARAREELQRAAAEVARLSGQLTAPVVDDVRRRFRYAGQRAMLGVGIDDADNGVRVRSVTPGGPAAEAGLEVGDTIVAIEGAALKSASSTQSPSELLLAQMANVDPGEEVTLRVTHDGKQRDAKVRAREVEPRQFFTFNGGPGNAGVVLRGPVWQGFFGQSGPWSQMQLVTLTPDLGAYFGTPKGILVVRGPDKAPLGLKDGDVILDIGGREPTSPEHALRILSSFAAGEKLKVTVMRKQRRETLDLTMPADG